MANLQKQLPNSPKVAYKIASVSKQFTAAAVLSLVQEQRISLDDDIRKFIPSFPNYGKPITVNNLLYHTSGIRDYMVLMWLCGISFEKPFSNRDALTIINRQSALNFTTGHQCVYSNSNYILLAEIIRHVTGTPIDAYVEEAIFRNLNMSNTGYGSEKPLLAFSYQKEDNQFTAFENGNTAMGDGGMFTTLGDLLKWDHTFYDSTSLAYRLLRRGRLENGNLLSYGMGIMTGLYRSEPIQSHPGAFLGYRSEILRFFNKKITIICLANSDEINPETITRQIADLYVFTGPVNADPPIPAVNNPDVFIGKYEVAPNVFIDITSKNGGIIGKVTGQPAQILYPDSINTFRIGQLGDKAFFSDAKSGVMQQLTIQQRRGNTIAQRVEIIIGDKAPDYEGKFYCSEQNATYHFFKEKDGLWFITGENSKVKAEILKKYNRIYFDYKGLESAVIEFSLDDSGKISGFTLNSGRVKNLKFVKEGKLDSILD